MREPRCPDHPDGRVRRRRTRGPRGRGIYPECVPADGTPPHLVDWADATSSVPLLETEVRLAPDIGPTPLTPRELVVLCEAANGYTAAETARHLAKGVQTVKTQRCRILLKLGAANTSQAVCLATQQGLLVVRDETVGAARAPSGFPMPHRAR